MTFVFLNKFSRFRLLRNHSLNLQIGRSTTSQTNFGRRVQWRSWSRIWKAMRRRLWRQERRRSNRSTMGFQRCIRMAREMLAYRLLSARSESETWSSYVTLYTSKSSKEHVVYWASNWNLLCITKLLSLYPPVISNNRIHPFTNLIRREKIA